MDLGEEWEEFETICFNAEHLGREERVADEVVGGRYFFYTESSNATG